MIVPLQSVFPKHLEPMLEKEFQYYLANQDEFLKKHLGKFLVIKGESIVGVFETEIDAYLFGIDKFEPGTFLIQQCLPGKDNYTQTFHSRVIFA